MPSRVRAGHSLRGTRMSASSPPAPLTCGFTRHRRCQKERSVAVVGIARGRPGCHSFTAAGDRPPTHAYNPGPASVRMLNVIIYRVCRCSGPAGAVERDDAAARLRHSTRFQPAAINSASSVWSGQARIDSARYSYAAGIRRQQPGDRRARPPSDSCRRPRNGRHRRRGELADHQPAARPGDPSQLSRSPPPGPRRSAGRTRWRPRRSSRPRTATVPRPPQRTADPAGPLAHPRASPSRSRTVPRRTRPGERLARRTRPRRQVEHPLARSRVPARQRPRAASAGPATATGRRS